MSKFCLLYSTASSEDEAKEIADLLLEKKLAACVNIIPGMKSLYKWKGKIEETEEIIIIIKTISSAFKDIEALLKDVHSYDCPCLIELNIENVNAPYLEWLEGALNIDEH
jgi:periplasmic divalent cation tolerance protein